MHPAASGGRFPVSLESFAPEVPGTGMSESLSESSYSSTAVLTLPGHSPVEVHARVTPRSRNVRLGGAFVRLLGFAVLAPIAAIVPPHIPWALAAVGAGLWFGFRQWRGEYVVEAFEGACPRCGSPLAIVPGSLVRLPHPIDCYNCHHIPLLRVEPTG